MPIVAKRPENDGDFERIPEGTHQAVCYAIWDLGKQEVNYQGDIKTQHKIMIAWEVNKRIQNEGEYKGKRFVISKRYTLSLSDKANLKKDLESWRGKAFTEEQLRGFDIETVIGANCLLSVTYTEKGDKKYPNVTSVMGIAEGMQKMTPETPKEAPQWVKDIQAKAVQSVDDVASEFDAQQVPDYDIALQNVINKDVAFYG